MRCASTTLSHVQQGKPGFGGREVKRLNSCVVFLIERAFPVPRPPGLRYKWSTFGMDRTWTTWLDLTVSLSVSSRQVHSTAAPEAFVLPLHDEVVHGKNHGRNSPTCSVRMWAFPGESTVHGGTDLPVTSFAGAGRLASDGDNARCPI